MLLARVPHLLLFTALMGLMPVQLFAQTQGACGMDPSGSSRLSASDGQPMACEVDSSCCCDGPEDFKDLAAVSGSCACSEPAPPPSHQPPVRLSASAPTDHEASPLDSRLLTDLVPPLFARLGSEARHDLRVEPPVRTILGIRLL